jgi:adenosylmethionine-8-amino-7-oxononanoate aminotransferase
LAQDPRIEHLRRCGTIHAFDVKAQHAGEDFAERFHRAGLAQELLIRPIGRSVYLMPPYVLDEAGADWLAQRVRRTLEAVLSGGCHAA